LSCITTTSTQYLTADRISVHTAVTRRSTTSVLVLPIWLTAFRQYHSITATAPDYNTVQRSEQNGSTFLSNTLTIKIKTHQHLSQNIAVIGRDVRRRRAADILLTPPPPIITDRRAATAAADRMSASHRRRFCDVFTSRCTPAICC